MGSYVPAFLCSVVNLDASGPVSYRFEAALSPANVSLAARQQSAAKRAKRRSSACRRAGARG